MIEIKPVAIGFQIEANSIELIQGSYTLGSNDGCDIKVLFFKDNVLQFVDKLVVIPSEIVATWTDDQPLIDYVLNELGLIVLPNVEVF